MPNLEPSGRSLEATASKSAHSSVVSAWYFQKKQFFLNVLQVLINNEDVPQDKIEEYIRKHYLDDWTMLPFCSFLNLLNISLIFLFNFILEKSICDYPNSSLYTLVFILLIFNVIEAFLSYTCVLWMRILSLDSDRKCAVLMFILYLKACSITTSFTVGVWSLMFEYSCGHLHPEELHQSAVENNELFSFYNYLLVYDTEILGMLFIIHTWPQFLTFFQTLAFRDNIKIWKIWKKGKLPEWLAEQNSDS